VPAVGGSTGKWTFWSGICASNLMPVAATDSAHVGEQAGHSVMPAMLWNSSERIVL
jgi:hypothetical protein